jgi:hypothetical protein
MEAVMSALLGTRIPPPREISLEMVPVDVTFRRGSLIPRIGGLLARMAGPAAAVTLRRTIVVMPGVRLSSELLAHELVHVRQWRDDPLFPIRYCIATLRYGYHDNPYEVEARSRSVSPIQPVDKRVD